MLKIGVNIRSVIPQIPGAMRSFATQVTGEGLRVGEARAKAEAPVRTGFLRSSIGSRMTSQSGGELFARANYAGYVNYGTRRMAGRPFMDRGAEAMKQHILDGWKTIEGRLPRV